MNKRTTAIDIANYIVDVVNNNPDMKGILTPIKLQKILYYVYVNCLVNRNENCLNNRLRNGNLDQLLATFIIVLKCLERGI